MDDDDAGGGGDGGGAWEQNGGLDGAGGGTDARSWLLNFSPSVSARSFAATVLASSSCSAWSASSCVRCIERAFASAVLSALACAAASPRSCASASSACPPRQQHTRTHTCDPPPRAQQSRPDRPHDSLLACLRPAPAPARPLPGVYVRACVRCMSHHITSYHGGWLAGQPASWLAGRLACPGHHADHAAHAEHATHAARTARALKRCSASCASSSASLVRIDASLSRSSPSMRSAASSSGPGQRRPPIDTYIPARGSERDTGAVRYMHTDDGAMTTTAATTRCIHAQGENPRTHAQRQGDIAVHRSPSAVEVAASLAGPGSRLRT
eukprot:COSAG01_NODE_7856_length_3023_cov_76.924103_2_plen_326_part_00